MAHIDRLGGRFLSLLPATCSEDAAFLDWLADYHDPGWGQTFRRPGGVRRIRTTSVTPDEPPWPLMSSSVLPLPLL
ncbi:hypothetical protein [Phytoactinopolyspora endophytica]|uniref:hypothetical protein n=1 Tax=Phytoactinopolyspora endophytica TaxID=1642495 RepID=UPI00101E1B5C|nr:hypothetical protein [Phytoactinopolyspora endophytica]